MHIAPAARLAVVVDCETTGIDPMKDSVVDIAVTVLNLDTGEELGSQVGVVKLSKEEWAQANPRSLQVNGFTWERVQREGVPREVLSQHIITLLDSHQISRQNAVFLCQNPAFDASFFNQIVSATERDAHGWPYRWLDLASMELGRHQSMPLTDLTKDKIAEAYGIPPEAKPHGAKNGVDHLIAIVKRILLSQDG